MKLKNVQMMISLKLTWLKSTPLGDFEELMPPLKSKKYQALLQN
jgi:hypothetical protein